MQATFDIHLYSTLSTSQGSILSIRAPINPTSMFLDCGRKLEQAQGRHADAPQKGPGWPKGSNQEPSCWECWPHLYATFLDLNENACENCILKMQSLLTSQCLPNLKACQVAAVMFVYVIQQPSLAMSHCIIPNLSYVPCRLKAF